MTLTDFYLLCFLLGFFLSVMALLSGTGHLNLPYLHIHHGGLPHLHAPHVGGRGSGTEISPVNIATIAAFLAWFGGAGFLMTHYYALWFLLGLGLASLTGVAGAAVVFWFLARVLSSPEENLDPADYDMVGVLGRVSSPIRTGGTGEMIYSQAGTRRSSGARSDDGTVIGKGEEVVVTRYDKGIAYVRRWQDLAESQTKQADRENL